MESLNFEGMQISIFNNTFTNLLVDILLCIAQPTLAYVHTLGNIGQPRTWLSEVLDQTSAQHSASVLHRHY